ncbi:MULTISPECIES: hypothetical protein [unclassified Streptomyces]|uniref:hypothetical protein n=1 Tax=unclassified Streptomyces TaxID=2593676 RepID=UPI0038252D87
MGSFVTRIKGTKAVKASVVAAMAAAAVSLTAPMSSASNEATWHDGCRGYWYSTSGHGYCYDATGFPSYGYFTNYDCNYETDEQHYDKLYSGYVGKYDTYECTFKINSTKVYQ